MNRKRRALTLCALAAALLLPIFTYAAVQTQSTGSGLVPCGVSSDPNVATECEACNLVELVQNIIHFLIVLTVPIAAIMIAWAGVLYFTASGSPERIDRGKSIFTHALFGFVIALSAWLIVNTILYTILDKNMYPNSSWFKVDCSTSQRIRNADIGTIINSVLGGIDPALATPGNASILCPEGTEYDAQFDNCYDPKTDTSSSPIRVPISGVRGDCSADRIYNAAAAGGYALTRAQADTLSCISMPESGCQGNPGTAKTPDGKSTSASGHFQIVLGLNDQCHNLNIPVCVEAARAAGYTSPSWSTLNCSSAFHGGRPDGSALSQACRAAAANFDCNTAAAACLVKQNPSFSDWTADSRSSVQRQCINTYNH